MLKKRSLHFASLRSAPVGMTELLVLKVPVPLLGAVPRGVVNGAANRLANFGMESGPGDRLAPARRCHHDAVRSGPGDGSSSFHVPRFDDGGRSRLGDDGKRFDHGAVGQRHGNMHQSVDRAGVQPMRLASPNALAIRETDCGQAGRLDRSGAPLTKMMTADVARRHECQRVRKPGPSQPRFQKSMRIDRGAKIAVANLDPDDIGDDRKARVKQRPAQRALGLGKARRQERRRAIHGESRSDGI